MFFLQEGLTDSEIEYVLFTRPNSKAREEGRGYAERTILAAKAKLEMDAIPIEKRVEGFLAEMKKNKTLEPEKPGKPKEKPPNPPKRTYVIVDKGNGNMVKVHRLGVGERIVHGQDEIVTEFLSDNDWKLKDTVFLCGLTIEHFYIINGREFYKVKEYTEVLSRSALLLRLDESAHTQIHGPASNVLNIILRNERPEPEEGGIVYSVQEDKDRNLSICENPILAQEMQADTWEELKPHVSTGATAEELQAFLDMTMEWTDNKALIPFGIGWAAPFAYLLRQKKWFIPQTWNWSPEEDMGKSLSASLVPYNAFGLEPAGKDDVDSDFRRLDLVNSVALYIIIDEGVGFSDKFFVATKKMSESSRGGKRGKKSLGQTLFENYGVLGVTANIPIPATLRPDLKRWIVSNYSDEDPARIRKNEVRVRNAARQLKKVGFQVIRWAVERWPTTDKLLEDMGQWAGEIKACFETSRGHLKIVRAEAWAFVYLGLKAYENACIQTGNPSRAISIEEFTNTCVAKGEADTWGLENSLLNRFTMQAQIALAGEKEFSSNPLVKIGLVPHEGKHITWDGEKWVLGGGTDFLLVSYPAFAKIEGQTKNPEERLVNPMHAIKMISKKYNIPLEWLKSQRGGKQIAFGTQKPRVIAIPLDVTNE
jgi:hypothetical protein